MSDKLFVQRVNDRIEELEDENTDWARFKEGLLDGAVISTCAIGAIATVLNVVCVITGNKMDIRFVKR